MKHRSEAIGLPDVKRCCQACQTTREIDSNAIQLEKQRGVCWLPSMVTETLNGVPLRSNPETASTVVEETVISATDPDITTQLEGSEETRKHKMHTGRSSHGVERQWNMHTDLRQARTEVEPR